MCQTLHLLYTCTHTRTVRLSTCRGNFTVRPKAHKPLKPACCGAYTLARRLEGECGDCLRAKAEERLQAGVAQGLDGEAGAFGVEIFQLEKRFPTVRRYQGFRRPIGDPGMKRTRGSLLSREVVAEEVVERCEGRTTLVGVAWDEAGWVSRFVVLVRRCREKEKGANQMRAL